MHTLSQILLSKWDPIGIVDEPQAHDEYDAYHGAVARLLALPDAEARIAEYLLDVERRMMGLPGDPARASRVARSLIAQRGA